MVLTAAAACTGAGNGDGEPGTAAATVVTALYPLAEAAAQVAGDAVDVVNLTPPSAEPHDLELTADQVDQILDADLVVYIAGFQPALDDAVEQRDGPVVDVSELAANRDDPHLWLDPVLYAKAVELITRGIAAHLDVDESSVQKNAAAFRAELTALDGEIRQALATCRRRSIIVAHDAFGYLAKRYDLEQLAIEGLSPESEPDPERLSTLADEIEARGITTVFYETLVSPDVAETLARETGARTAVLNPLEGLTEAELAAGKDYATVMKENAAALRAALECT